MQKLNVSFYILSENKAQDFLGFICQLTQTALNKSTHSLLILTEDQALLDELDKGLWSHDATSFIPHQRLDHLDVDDSAENDNDIDPSAMSAPVLLSTYLPADFNGMVINTTKHIVNEFIKPTSNIQLTRILEIIKPDNTSVQQGRDKYKYYKNLDYELTHFKV
ncbi:DNA polymerase III subunit chi [Psychrobacter jeotgali]|uniref:DNA polymerase III subunit chi n=1 Tax=Psychrobacter jeotgali TaxID=179010 RepID=UPI00191B08B2|nr:DNA polymerase III subunit chi [Psychrobacter jeotgali]